MGLSLTQILFTVVAVVLVWRVIGFLERRQKLRERPSRPETPAVAVELKPCPRCGTYVPGDEACPTCAAERRG